MVIGKMHPRRKSSQKNMIGRNAYRLGAYCRSVRPRVQSVYSGRTVQLLQSFEG